MGLYSSPSSHAASILCTYSLPPDAKRTAEASGEGSAAMSDASRSYTDMFGGSPSGDSEIGPEYQTLVISCDVRSPVADSNCVTLGGTWPPRNCRMSCSYISPSAGPTWITQCSVEPWVITGRVHTLCTGCPADLCQNSSASQHSLIDHCLREPTPLGQSTRSTTSCMVLATLDETNNTPGKQQAVMIVRRESLGPCPAYAVGGAGQ